MWRLHLTTMMNIKENGGAAHEYLKSQDIETHYEIIPDIGHYRIYFEQGL